MSKSDLLFTSFTVGITEFSYSTTDTAQRNINISIMTESRWYLKTFNPCIQALHSQDRVLNMTYAGVCVCDLGSMTRS